MNWDNVNTLSYNSLQLKIYYPVGINSKLHNKKDRYVSKHVKLIDKTLNWTTILSNRDKKIVKDKIK